MITGFIGDKGSGKTLLMTCRTVLWFIKGSKIFANYKIRIKHEKLDAKRLLKLSPELNNCVIAVDEIGVIFDSYDHAKDRTKIAGYLVLQTRKRHVNFYYTAQDEMLVFARLRRHTDYVVWCQARPDLGLKDGEPIWFEYTVTKKFWGRVVKHFLFNGEKIRVLYDTNEVISDFGIPV